MMDADHAHPQHHHDHHVLLRLQVPPRTQSTEATISCPKQGTPSLSMSTPLSRRRWQVLHASWLMQYAQRWAVSLNGGLVETGH